jgi:Uri superfamily endonuclease
MEEAPGTYILVLHMDREAHLRVAQLGAHSFKAGFYCYAGSARGPGGLRARLGRHLRQHKKPHWHIDYLLPQAAVVEVWTAPSTARLECLSTHTLLGMPGAEVLIPGFGSSDCRCETHLLYFFALPSLRGFCGRLRLLNPGVPFFTGTLHSSAAS